ncbi:hypothetical protein JM83_1918 [Gillisia sp. Hel_I_86]|uniref:hypothetical protein n=1 Tax=Gillisia sp. Hel_I_86 TaxID=1249981 RepID=UPI00119B5F14|nr:hypothetical protein [Gillisia sp. Hel_I_86]TVZ26918.1 hypothetical protein JM83_1918 [Gillisia sp. Hel_I_86]
MEYKPFLIKLVSKYFTDSLSAKEEMDLGWLISQEPYAEMFKKHIVDDYCVDLLWREIDVDRAFQELWKVIQLKEEIKIRLEKLELQPM